MKGEGIVAVGVVVTWLLSVLFSLVITFGLVWAAFHFICKYW